MARLRIFLAVEISDAIRTKATALQEKLAKTGADVRWETPENFHVTLNFLGDVDDRDIHAVCRAVAGVAADEPAFPMAVSGVGAFPTPRRPRTIWAGIAYGADPLRRLYAALEPRLLELGVYRREDRGYTPHLTLGRVKDEAAGHLLAAELPKYRDWSGGQTAVEEVVVFSSQLRRDGPEYTALGRGLLRG